MFTSIRSVALFGLCFTAASCLDDGTDVEDASPDTNVITPYLSVAGGVTITGGTTGRMGKVSEQSCFLSGVKGKLFVNNPALTIAEVFPHSDGFWRAHATSGVTAVATCVNYPYPGGGMELHFENNIDGGQVFSQAHRRCFLRRVAASIGFWHNPEVTQTSRLGISDDGSQWWWGSSFMTPDIGTDDFGDATALCIDAPDSSKAWGIPVHGLAGLTLTSTVKDGDGNPIAAAHTLCALSEISGRWDLPDPILGNAAGVTLSNTGTNWTVTTTGARDARISCWR